MRLVRAIGLFELDLVVVRDDCSFLDREEETTADPSIIIEIVTPATESWDREVKFIDYRRSLSVK